MPVPPGQEFTYRLTAEKSSVGVWPYHDHSPSMSDSVAGGLYGALSISAPGEPAPDREFVVFLSSHLGFMTIDGRAFVGNTPVFRAKVGELVQWDVLTLGDDFHTFHVHGHRWEDPSGRVVDNVTIGPGDMYTARFIENNPGRWLYHCHVFSHLHQGMSAWYLVN